MKIKGKNIRFSQLICLLIYYGFARYLPCSYFPLGKLWKKIRYALCKRIFKSCGKDVNIERMAYFGTGINVQIGDHSGLGVNCKVPDNVIIGDHVMMGPNCYMFSNNHEFSRTDIPMGLQGIKQSKAIVIEDDIWIGRNVTILPGRHISKGSIVGACCLLCKDFPPYSVIGGNPSKLIKSRIEQ